MEELDFTPSAQSAIYDPAVALKFFRSAGKPESLSEGARFFVENEKNDKLFTKGEKMYLLLEGEVSLIRGTEAIGVVREGEIFGEMSSISQLPRSATAVAKTACRVISLEPRQFQQAIQKTPEFALMLMNIMINRLRQTIASLNVSSALSEEDKWRECRVFDRKFLADLVRELQDHPPVHCPLHKVIMSEGEAGMFLYVVLEGRVAVSIQSTIVEKIGPGGVFGEMALVDKSPRIASADAETDCSLLAINRNDFLALVRTRPAFSVSLLKAVAERLRYMTSHYK
ncbi:MAG: cyclic nucleotide-binding domain-containing protein [Betaproteobacteria bacterium]|nr:cyclic nucleotide-binding domain-containing protein [Betaproteobacteria bacterium]